MDVHKTGCIGGVKSTILEYWVNVKTMGDFGKIVAFSKNLNFRNMYPSNIVNVLEA